MEKSSKFFKGRRKREGLSPSLFMDEAAREYFTCIILKT